MTPTLGVGVVGIGWVALEHLRAFLRNPRARVTWLCSRDEPRARARLAKAGIEVPDARITRRYEDLLRSGALDIVSIATPNHLHAAQAAAAEKAGKHILLEKPTGLDLQELARIRDAVKRPFAQPVHAPDRRYMG